MTLSSVLLSHVIRYQRQMLRNGGSLSRLSEIGSSFIVPQQQQRLSLSSSSMFRTDYLNSLKDDNDSGIMGSYNSTTNNGQPTTTGATVEVELPVSEREQRRRRGVKKLYELDEERERLRATKKGRGWSDPWDIDPFVERGLDYNGLLDWSPEYVSRVSLERLHIFSSKDGSGRTIPTLQELATDIALPLPPPPNPAQHMKAYALYRKRYLQKYIYTRVSEIAEPRVNVILKLNDWDSKQDAIDILYEQVEFLLRDKETILSKQPNFGTMVERAIEQYLRTVQKTLKEKANIKSGSDKSPPPNQITGGGDVSTATTAAVLTPEQIKMKQRKKDEVAIPIFIDCFDKTIDKTDNAVPHILLPMKSSVPLKPMIGRMVEEWELSAHKTTKRIMLRQCTRTIAQMILNATNPNVVPTIEDFNRTDKKETLNTTTTRLEDSTTTTPNNNDTSSSIESLKSEGMTDTIPTSTIPVVADTSSSSSSESTAISVLASGSPSPPLSTRILVHGAQGVGKTAVLASMVAIARQSNAIVLFIPDGNQMHQNGFYIEPDEKRAGIYNLPLLSQNVCQHLIESHETDMKDFMVDTTIIDTYFTDTQIGKMKEYAKGTSMSLVSLLNYGIERSDLASMCYSAAMHVLMTQKDKDFIMVLDEANCFFIRQGHYYHETYDYDVKKSIPYHQINLFEPFLNTMNLTSLPPNDDHYSPTLLDTLATTTTTMSVLPTTIQRGAVIISTTESHAIPRSVTDNLVANAKVVSTDTATAATSPSSLSTPSLHVVEVPRLTAIEVQHMLSNYEATGVGNLRLDRGATVMNQQEVSYLHMVSGGIPQHLMNACML